jgi:hypothetical protein
MHRVGLSLGRVDGFDQDEAAARKQPIITSVGPRFE